MRAAYRIGRSCIRSLKPPATFSSPPPAAVRPAAGMAAVPGAQGLPDPAAAIEFLHLLENLKLTKRTGWVRCNVSKPESIADHMYRMAMMALLTSTRPDPAAAAAAGEGGGGAASGGGGSSSSSSSSIDSVHCMKMALVHDVAEALVGDITPHCNVSDEEKYKLEAEAIGKIKSMLGERTAAAHEIEALWLEYEAQETAESHLVKDFDKLEMILQAAEYEGKQGLELQQFFDSTQGKFKTPLGKAWAAAVLQKRAAQQQ